MDTLLHAPVAVHRSSVAPVDDSARLNGTLRPERFDDGELVNRLRVGSAQAIEQIVAHYRPRLYLLAFRFTGNHHEAEEIVQETWVRAFQSAPRFRGDSSLGTWLYAIARNLARNRYWHWRRRKRHVTLSLDEPNINAAARDALMAEDPTAVQETEQNELAERIELGMAQLSERDRRILVLRNVHNVTYVEIADILGVAVGTVKSRIARARERLRAIVVAPIEADRAMPRNQSN